MDSHIALGFWSMAQREQYINVLEMKAVLLALQAFAVHIKGHSVLLANDNTTVAVRPGAKYIEKYSNTLQLLSLINDYNYRTCRNVMLTITIEM